MYRIVASDMDETLLGDDHQVAPADIEAIREMRSLGCLFVPASGRSYGSVLESLSEVPRELLEGSYLISYNGGCINRIGDERPLESHVLPFGRVAALFAYAVALGEVSLHVYEATGQVWTWGMQPEERAYLAGHMAHTDLEAPSVDFLRDTPVSKILYCIPDGSARLAQIERRMPPELKAGTSVTFSSGRYLEFNPEGVDKGSGLRSLARLLGVDMADTIACGDAANDAPMVRAAGVGVAVSNARDGLADVADYQARASNNDAILAEVLEQIVRPAALA